MSTDAKDAPAPAAFANQKSSGNDIASLLQTTEGALALTTAMHRGEIPRDEFGANHRSCVRDAW